MQASVVIFICTQSPTLTPTPRCCHVLGVQITGNTNDCYGLGTLIRTLQQKQWHIVVHARRAGGGLPLSSPKFNVLGDAVDTADAIKHVQQQMPGSPLLLVGLSAGSAAMCRYLGDHGEETPIKAAVAISPGYQIPEAWWRCSVFYDWIILKKVKSHFLEKNASILQSTPELAGSFAACMSASTIGDMHHHSYPLHGKCSSRCVCVCVSGLGVHDAALCGRGDVFFFRM